MTTAEKIQDVPTDILARNFVTMLIQTHGNINKWDELTKMLIRELRGEPAPAPAIPATPN